MKSVRNLYMAQFIATTFVAIALVLGGFAVQAHSDWTAGIRLVLGLVCIIGAIGAAWLCWQICGLTKSIASIASILSPDHADKDGFLPGRIAGQCAEAINNHLKASTDKDQAFERDLMELNVQVQLSERQKRNTEAIIYSIRDAVVVVDEYDRLLMANEAAERLFGFDFQKAQLEPVNELIGPQGSDFVNLLRQSRQSRILHTKRELTIPYQSEEQVENRVYDCIVSCVYENDGQICAVVAVLHDITREKEISQMKNDFVSHVSHELKTPLASIMAYSEMLADGEADDEQTRKEFYSVIQNQAKRLNRLIEDILNISRIESGLIKVSKEPVSLTILIEEQMQMIKGYAEEKDIKLKGQKPIVFDQVFVDKDMVSQVIVNLLSNAVKYTKSGGSVTIKTEVDEIADVARVSVTDTGVGIPEDEVGHVFDKFYRVSANKGCAKGTGLGLNLVKQIVEKVHSGRVFVKSEVGVGSTFGFEIPLAKAEMVSG